MPAVYDALRKLAQQRLAAEQPGHTLQATVLVHDVYLKLASESPERWKDTAHFFNSAAEAMRRVLIDHARARSSGKREGDWRRAPLTEVVDVATLAESADPDDVLALDAAVKQLEMDRPEVGAVVRLRFYAGLSVEQTAGSLSTSPATVTRMGVCCHACKQRRLRGFRSRSERLHSSDLLCNRSERTPSGIPL
jgi:RNA polymerase sigma factor (TIGR02999 family)